MTSAAATTSALLAEFYADKLAAVTSHLAHARLIGQYDANNTYQYVINREEVQLGWLAKAIGDEGGAVPETSATIAPPKDKADARALFDEDRNKETLALRAQQWALTRTRYSPSRGSVISQPVCPAE